MNVTNINEKKKKKKWGHFLELCADFSNKPKPVKAIYILHLKFLITLFQKMILWKKYMNK